MAKSVLLCAESLLKKALLNNCICNISTTPRHRVKRTFSASKTERETITKTSVLQSSKNRKIRGNGENLVSVFYIFFIFFDGSHSLGINTLNISFSRAFEGITCCSSFVSGSNSDRTTCAHFYRKVNGWAQFLNSVPRRVCQW